MTIPAWLRTSTDATIEATDALTLAAGWWAFWVLDLQAWQAFMGGALPAWGWLALAALYAFVLAVRWPRFIGGPAMLAGLSGACSQTLAINSIASIESTRLTDGTYWPALAVVSTIVACAVLVVFFAEVARDAGATPQRDAWTLALVIGQACAVLTAVIAWAVSGLCC
jgi:hypothetical protein